MSMSSGTQYRIVRRRFAQKQTARKWTSDGIDRFTRGRRRLRAPCAALVIFAVGAAGSGTATAGTIQPTRSAGSPAPGVWTVLGQTRETDSRPTVLSLSNGRGLVLWHKDTGTKATYEYAQAGQYGGVVVGSKDMFAGHHWDILTGDPTLLMYQGRPLLVFTGEQNTNPKNPLAQGCILGSLETASAWAIQTWSLSKDCLGPDAGYGDGESISAKGVLSAAWPSPGNGAVNYHIGVSLSIPAKSDDQSIPLANGDVLHVNEVADSHGNDHFYGAWYREFSNPPSGDGLYAADLTAGSKPKKAPGSGTVMVQNQVQNAAMAGSGAHAGIYLAYCPNTPTCKHVNLWRYGAPKARAVPGSSGATVSTLSPGPAGRLWVGWYNDKTNRVYTVRTNKADNYFGPVESYKARGCGNDDNARIALSGGSSQRLDVVVACAATGSTTVLARVTQSLTGLGLGASTGVIHAKKGGSVTYHVTDAGDPVAGATVKGDGHSGKTNASGSVTFTFPKGARTGSFQITATMANYFRSTTGLRVE
jgi:hypothetical protein